MIIGIFDGWRGRIRQGANKPEGEPAKGRKSHNLYAESLALQEAIPHKRLSSWICNSAACTSHTRSQKLFTISEVAADWH